MFGDKIVLSVSANNIVGYLGFSSDWSSYLNYQVDRKFPINFTIDKRKLIGELLVGRVYQTTIHVNDHVKHYLVLWVTGGDYGNKKFKVSTARRSLNSCMFELFVRCRIWVEQGVCFG